MKKLLGIIAMAGIGLSCLLWTGCRTLPAPPRVVTLPGDGDVSRVAFALDTPIPKGAVAYFEINGERYPLTAANDTLVVLFPQNAIFPFTFTPPKGLEDIGLTLSGDLERFWVDDPSEVFGKPPPPPPCPPPAPSDNEPMGVWYVYDMSGNVQAHIVNLRDPKLPPLTLPDSAPTATNIPTPK